MSKTRLDEFLPFHRPFLGEEEIAEVVDTLRSGWLTMGPKTFKFEEKFAALVGSDHAVAVSSCTAALHLALDGIGLEEGDEVITSPYTFTATVAAIRYTGATPVLADTLADYPNLDPSAVRAAVTDRTRAIIPVHFAGAPCDLDALGRVATDAGVPIIEDAAHALPAWYGGRRIGSIGEATAFSFYAGKNITTGEGGMLTTNNAELAETVRRRRLHGISRDAWKRYSDAGSWYYEVSAAGFKYNMTDIQASIGIHQLDRLETFHARRLEIVSLYDRLLASVPGVVRPRPPDDGESAWHLYVVEIDGEVVSCSRGDVIEELRADNIGSSVHFIPIHHHPLYQEELGCGPEDFPNASRIYQRSISLPLFPSMSDAEVEAVVASLARIMRANLR
ncbi:MAG: DegT/DnrJ/EryC1/StrS family aminotransferase [Deltaproteobacteria bacterium]